MDTAPGIAKRPDPRPSRDEKRRRAITDMLERESLSEFVRRVKDARMPNKEG